MSERQTYGELWYTIGINGIAAEAMAGSTIEKACRDAATLANRYAKSVGFDFNGIDVLVEEGDVGSEAARRWLDQSNARYAESEQRQAAEADARQRVLNAAAYAVDEWTRKDGGHGTGVGMRAAKDQLIRAVTEWRSLSPAVRP